ncbi:hypothetical protein MPSEU_000062400 [Mayamaea pseudoterrestris]|nr:hypothetical protein MPSEU_000062400 [Mayamaea pseudoterrestris]
MMMHFRASAVSRIKLSARRLSTTKSDIDSSQFLVTSRHRTNLIFGANTDVGKTLVSAGLVRQSLQKRFDYDTDAITRYIKPLQCGGSDEAFVRKHCSDLMKKYEGDGASDGIKSQLVTKTLFNWNTPSSPHAASLAELKPVSDKQVLDALIAELSYTHDESSGDFAKTTYVETAGGVLSPSSASPLNNRPHHAAAAAPSNENATSRWGWQTQADLYQPLVGQMPVVLVGDGRLGGISVTLSALESLVLRGYDVAAIILIESPDHDNVLAIREHVSRHMAIRSGSGERLFANPMQSILSLPPIPSDPNEPLDEWYASSDVTNTFRRLDSYLNESWEGQVADLNSLTSSGSDIMWWPFTQHGNLTNNEEPHDVTHIDSASGDDYIVLKNSHDYRCQQRVNMFDASASWWTQGLGHGNSTMALAAAAAAGRYGHVIFPQVVHAPAINLSHYLINENGPGDEWADRVFFSDDGSTAMEVAIKMGMKLYQKRMKVTDEQRDEMEWMVCAQAGCYHGDTLGVMDVAEPSVYNQAQTPWYESRGLFLETPTFGYRDGMLEITHPEGSEPTNGASSTFGSIRQAMDVGARMISRSLFSHYKETIELQWMVYEHSGGPRRKIGCVIIEPVLMGAGGMQFVDPLWQKALIEIAEARNVPVIFDEVASGLHRVGVVSCREIIRSNPDIACYAKLLTGGLVPMSVTLATEETFEAFLGDTKGQALLHGHSYTAHPVGCVSALHALEAYDAVLPDHDKSKGPRMWFDEDQVKSLSHLPLVDKAFTLGTVLAVTINSNDGTSGYDVPSPAVPIVEKLHGKGIFARPLGNVVYIMASPVTSNEECRRLAKILHEAIDEQGTSHVIPENDVT